LTNLTIFHLRYVLKSAQGFSIGNAHSSFYNGSRFSEATGAVVVTLTYRLGVFGFPGAPDNAQNLGLRDQRRAVKWVHQNIAEFGGDTAKITIFGQSSGGVAADWWTFAYKDTPLVNGIISESGNAFSFSLNTREQQTKNWYNVSAALGCASIGNTLDCVRSKDVHDVLAAAARLPATPGGNPVRSTPAFSPAVDNETVFSGYTSLLKQGRFAKIVSLHNLTRTYYPIYRSVMINPYL
jgi:cholinesterase